MKKRYLALLCAAMLMLALCACKAESSNQTTVTVTSSSTDENGVTTTTTNTSEAGVTVGTDGVKTTENQTTETVVETPAPTEEPEDAQEEAEEEFTFDDWAARFTGGAIGRNADGDQFVLAWDDPDDITYAALMILSSFPAALAEGPADWQQIRSDLQIILSWQTGENGQPQAVYAEPLDADK